MSGTLTEQLEPGVEAMSSALYGHVLGGGTVDGFSALAPALFSLAVSAKRIADAIDGTAMGVDITESLAGLAHALIYQRTK